MINTSTHTHTIIAAATVSKFARNQTEQRADGNAKWKKIKIQKRIGKCHSVVSFNFHCRHQVTVDNNAAFIVKIISYPLLTKSKMPEKTLHFKKFSKSLINNYP